MFPCALPPRLPLTAPSSAPSDAPTVQSKSAPIAAKEAQPAHQSGAAKGKAAKGKAPSEAAPAGVLQVGTQLRVPAMEFGVVALPGESDHYVGEVRGGQ